MGSGKSTVGRQLAVILDRPFVDNDEQVHAATGKTVAEISEQRGVAEMRRLESQALVQALAWPVPAVVTAAAGTILDERVRQSLLEPYVVWLLAEPATLAGRVAADPLRPLLGGHPEQVLRAQNEMRNGLYAEVADLAVDVNGRSPEEIVATIMSALPS